MVTQCCKSRKVSDLYTLKWLLWCYMNFTSIFKKCGKDVKKWNSETLLEGI